MGEGLKCHFLFLKINFYKCLLSKQVLSVLMLSVSPGPPNNSEQYKMLTSRHLLGRILIRNSPRRFSSKDKEFYVDKLNGSDQGLVLFNFNRKKRHNALSRSFVEQLNEALEETAFDSSVRVVIIRSLVPGTFCAGRYYENVCFDMLQILLLFYYFFVKIVKVNF